MALSVIRVQLAHNVATALLTKGLGFNVVGGAAMDPIPVLVKNESSATIYIGGSNVSLSNGMSLPPGAMLAFAIYSNDIPYAFDPTGSSPVVSVMAGRQ